MRVARTCFSAQLAKRFDDCISIGGDCFLDKWSDGMTHFIGSMLSDICLSDILVEWSACGFSRVKNE